MKLRLLVVAVACALALAFASHVLAGWSDVVRRATLTIIGGVSLLAAVRALKGPEPFEEDLFEGDEWALYNVAETLPRIDVSLRVGEPNWQTATLFSRAGQKVDGLRFSVPVGLPRDLYWCFAMDPAPPKGTSWHVLGIKSTRSREFRKLKPQTIGGQPFELVVVQNLTGQLLQPQREYILWFKMLDPRPTRLFFGFHLHAPLEVEGKDANQILGLGLDLTPL